MYDYSNPNQDPPDYGDPNDWFYGDKTGEWLYGGDDEAVFQRYLREFEAFEVWYINREHAAAQEEALSSGHFIDRESDTYKKFVDRIYEKPLPQGMESEPEPEWLTYWLWGLAGFILMCGVILLL